MVYQVRNLVADCATGRGRLKLDPTSKQEAYAQVWDSICRWVVDQYQRGKGVFIPNFCRLGWEIKAGPSGGHKQAPFFELTDHFRRSHGLPVLKRPVPLQRASLGEINFIRLAIKFSGSLTKDVVFSGSRDLFQRIGRVLASGAKMSLDMKVGKFIARDRKIGFQWDNSMRETVLMRHPMEYSGRVTRTPSTASRRGRKKKKGLRGSSSTPVLPPAAPAGGGIELGYALANSGGAEPGPSKPPAVPNYAASSRSIGTGAGAGQTRGVPALRMASAGDATPAEAPAFDDPEEDLVGDSYEDAPLTATTYDKQKQWGYLSAHHSENPVLEEAFARHQQQLLTLAEHKAQEHIETEEAMWQQELEMRRQRRLAQEKKQELQAFIKKQMLEQQERRRLEPIRKYATLADTQKPTGAMTPPSLPDDDGEHHNGAIIRGPTMYDFGEGPSPQAVRAREDLKTGLLEQIKSKEAAKKAAKARAMEQERRYLDHVRQEAEEQRLFQKMQHQIVKRDLMHAWDREIQLKHTLQAKEMEGKRGRRRASAAGSAAGSMAPSARAALSSSGPLLGLSVGGGGLPAPVSKGFAGSSRRLPGGGGAYRGSARS